MIQRRRPREGETEKKHRRRRREGGGKTQRRHTKTGTRKLCCGALGSAFFVGGFCVCFLFFSPSLDLLLEVKGSVTDGGKLGSFKDRRLGIGDVI